MAGSEGLSLRNSDFTNDVPFAERIRKLREKSGLTKADVARSLGLSSAAYWFYEDGRYRPSTIELYHALADALGCDISYLTFDDERFAGMEEQNTEEVNSENENAEEADIEASDTGEGFDVSDMTLGQKLTKLREEKGLTRNQVADLAGVGHSTYGKYESDTNLPFRDETFIRLAEVLGCDVSYLKDSARLAYVARNDPKKELGRRIREARISAGLGMKEAARLIGIPGSTYSNYEIGYSRPKDVGLYDKFVTVLGIDADILKDLDPRYEGYSGSLDLSSSDWETVPGVYSDDDKLESLVENPASDEGTDQNADRKSDHNDADEISGINSGSDNDGIPNAGMQNSIAESKSESRGNLTEKMLSSEQSAEMRPAGLMHEVIQIVSRLSALLAGNKLTREEKEIIKASIDMAFREGTED